MRCGAAADGKNASQHCCVLCLLVHQQFLALLFVGGFAKQLPKELEVLFVDENFHFRLDAFRQLGAQMGQILSGQNPSEMPFLQPTNFRLSINMKAAQKIGVVLPQTLLVSADEVME